MPKYAEFQTFREQNFITEADGDMLHREARALAIRRIEESARTEADFQNVLYWWDKLDANRERKERDHEIGRSTHYYPLLHRRHSESCYVLTVVCESANYVR